MSRDLRLQLVLDVLEKASGPLKKVQLGSNKTAKALKASREALKGLQRQQGDISSFKKLQEATSTSTDKLNAARQRTAELAKQMQATEKPSKRLTAQFNSATRQAKKLKAAHIVNRDKLHALGKTLENAGIKTKMLDRYQAKLTRQVNNANSAIDAQKSKLERLNTLHKQRAKIGVAGTNVRTQAGSLAGQGAVAGAVGGYFFKTQFLDTAAQFEDLEAVLRAVEGSSEKARQAMLWASDFAAKTPYELAEVTEAYKQLRAYGLDPTTGLLQDLGDTAAAMNKPVMQAVEAMADAITGENERLKEFGIRAAKAGGQISYEYTDKAGKQQIKTVDGNNRAQIESTLRSIWNERFSGAMDERSRTWNGMVSNMGDQWSRFTNMVMAAGLFDWMKAKLGGVLATIDGMAANGTLQALANEWGTRFKEFANGMWEVGSAIHSVTTKIASMVGGWENLMWILVALKLAPLVSALLSLGAAIAPLAMSYLPLLLTGFKALGMFMLTNPIGIAIAAIAGAAYLIYDNWAPISAFFKKLWADITAIFERFVNYLGNVKTSMFNAGGEIINGLIGGLKSKFTELKSTVTGIADGASNWFKDKLGIRSPSRVFVEHGSNVMAGLEKGLGNNRNTLRPMLDIGNRLKRVGTGLAIGAVAMNAAAFDNRPPLQAGGNSAGGSSISIGAIHIHATPGMDEQALARMVAAEIAKLQTRNAASNRSRLQDDD